MWLSVLEKYFPKKSWRRHYRKIIFYILAVDSGLKTSFLWDFGPSVSSSMLSAFLESLKTLKLTSLKIFLVILKEDFFVTNPNLVLQTLSQKRLYVNVSDHLSEHEIFEQNDLVEKMIDFLKIELNNLKKGKCKLELDENFCVPTLFGLLLNYPVIYFFEKNHTKSLFTLKVVKVFCKFNFENASERMEICSFSFPESLLDSRIDFCVKAWFDRLPNVNQNFYSDIVLEKSVENVNCFAL